MSLDQNPNGQNASGQGSPGQGSPGQGSPGQGSSGQSAGPPPPPRRSTFFAVFPSIMLPMFLAVLDQTIVAPIYGRLGDAFGRRRLMFVALGVFIVASLLCAASTSVVLLTLARLLQGLGGGGLMTLSQALVGEAFPPRERARYQGYLAAVAVCANTFGPVVGGYLTEHFGWQSVFLINVPVGLLAVWLTRKLENR